MRPARASAQTSPPSQITCAACIWCFGPSGPASIRTGGGGTRRNQMSTRCLCTRGRRRVRCRRAGFSRVSPMNARRLPAPLFAVIRVARSREFRRACPQLQRVHWPSFAYDARSRKLSDGFPRALSRSSQPPPNTFPNRSPSGQRGPWHFASYRAPARNRPHLWRDSLDSRR